MPATAVNQPRQLLEVVESEDLARDGNSQNASVQGNATLAAPLPPLQADADRIAPPEVSTKLSKRVVPSTKRVSVYLTLVALTVCPALNSLPWLFEGMTIFGWLGIVCAMLLACRPGITSNFWITWLWGSCVLGIAFHWSPAAMAYTIDSGLLLGTAVAAPLFIWDGLRYALGFWLATKLTRDPRFYWIAAAATTIALEYTMPGVFPWKIGMVQLSNPWLLQGVEIFGSSFATFVAFAIAGAIQNAGYSIYKHYSSNDPEAGSQSHGSAMGKLMNSLVCSPALIAVIAIMTFNACVWMIRSQQMAVAPKLTVGLVQVDPSYTESTENARALTESIADQVDLVCWPESSAGNYDLQLTCLSDDEKNFELSRDPERGLRPWPNPSCELLIGGKNYSGEDENSGELYVTAMLIDADENIMARHNKRFLMPFGEYVPGEDYIPGLSQLFDMGEYVQPGKSVKPIESATGARIGAMLCFEDMVPRAARETTADRANLLVSLANGSAFESPFTLYQHRLISHMRAIECRRYFVRCAATGETCVINPLGQIEARLPTQTNDALVAEVGLLDGETIYCRLPWITPIATFCTLLFFCVRARSSRNLQTS